MVAPVLEHKRGNGTGDQRHFSAGDPADEATPESNACQNVRPRRSSPSLEQKASHSQSISHLLPVRGIVGRSERCITWLKEYSSGNKFAVSFCAASLCIRQASCTGVAKIQFADIRLSVI